MIDTMKFKIPIELSDYQKMAKKCGENVKHKPDGMPTHTTNTVVFWGKGSAPMKLFASSENNVLMIEFSLPKYFYGHNVYLFYPSDLKKILLEIKEKLEKHFAIFVPPIQDWVVQRIDLCYNYKFPSQPIAEQILSSLESYDYPRKKKVIHPVEGIQYLGSSFNVKFYLKQNEILNNDLKKSHINASQKEFLTKLSEGVIRFEITMFKHKLKSLFNRETHYHDWTDNQYLEGEINNHLRNILGKSQCQILDEWEVWNRLQKTYSPKKSLELFQYVMASRTNKTARQILNANYHPSTISRKKVELAQANVGILYKKGTYNQLKYDLLVPNKLVTNTDNGDVAEATQPLSTQNNTQNTQDNNARPKQETLFEIYTKPLGRHCPHGEVAVGLAVKGAQDTKRP